jgi:predicted RecB family nuclease
MTAPSVITSTIFEAFLHCETKAYLLLEGAVGLSSDVQDWQAAVANDFKRSASKRLQSTLLDGEYSVETPSLESLRRGAFRVFFDPLICASGINAQLHVLQRLPLGRDAPTFIYLPLRFVRSEKLKKSDKLLIAFDALAISRCTGTSLLTGKIIHGAEFTTVTIALPKLIEKAELILDRIALRQVLTTAPPLVLNRHCPECEFQSRCRQLAIEKDDLGLLPNMGEAERKRQNARGIFTVTQLSHTYRPRRRSTRKVTQPPRHDSALKAPCYT